MRVLHVFYNFLPDLNGGSIRSAGIVSGQAANGISIVCVSSPFQPGWGHASVEDYRGIKLYRAYKKGNPLISEAGSSIWTRIRKIFLFPGFVRLIRRVAKREKATVIHAHSTFYCGLAAILAARSLRIPVIYEARSLWEERGRRIGPTYRAQAVAARLLETVALRGADRVVAINLGLSRNISARGVPGDRIFVVPNAMEDDIIRMGNSCCAPSRVRRFGYIGNISVIEGLDILVDAFRQAFPKKQDVSLEFFGSGAYFQELRAKVEKLGDERVRLWGPFDRSELGSVYERVDCVVIPRRRSKLNDTVTPLKPLEAMALKRLVCVSDVGGLLEVIGDRGNAVVFPAEDVNALANTLMGIYRGEIDVSGIAMRGFDFVSRERNWNAIAKKYWEVYGGL